MRRAAFGGTSIRWSRRDRWVALFIIAFALSQLVLPVVFLAQRGGMFWTGSGAATGEQPFSWQMYSVLRAPASARVVMRDGSSVKPRLEHLLGDFGAHLAYDDDGISDICEALPGAERVTVTFAGVLREREC